MTRFFLTALVACLIGLPLEAQERQPTQERLPDGRMRSEAILQAEHQKSLRDLEELIKLAQQLKQELEKNDYHVLSLESVRTAQRIEQLAKRIRGRFKRF